MCDGRGRRGAPALGLAAALAANPPLAAEPQTAPNERELALTVYSQGAALVQDRRTISFPAEDFRLVWSGVAPALQRESVRFAAGDRVLEGYRVRQRPVSMQALLEAYLGRAVSIEQESARGPAQMDALLVSAEPPLASVDGELRSVEPAELLFPEGLPPYLGGVPALELELAPVPKPGTATGADPATVSYLTEGFSWSLDYVATLGPEGNQLDLVARATIDNDSGMDLADAETELVAGQLNLPREDAPVARMALESADAARRDEGSEAFGDLQRYPLDEPISVADGERYSRRLFDHRGIPVQRRYVLAARSPQPLRGEGGNAGWRPVPLATELEWISQQGPLPTGTIRVYRQSASGELRFAGGDRISDRPQGRPVRIEPGRPFDITARRRQTDFERLEPRTHAVGHAIELHNGSVNIAPVRVEEPMAGDWQIIEANHPWERAGAHIAVWQLDLAPGETRELRYRARVER